MAKAGDSGDRLALLARVERDRGHDGRAEALLERAVRHFDLESRPLDGARQLRVLAFFRLQSRRDFTGAREALDDHDHRTAEAPLDRARGRYYRALLARDTGDVHSALALLNEAEVLLGAEAGMLRHDISTVQAGLLNAFGRYAEAAERLRALEAQLPPATPPCRLARLETNLGWTLLLATEAGRPLGSPQPALARAQKRFRDQCPRPQSLANVRVNLALEALQRRDVDAARRHIEAAHEALPGGATRAPHWLAPWWQESEARLKLQAGEPRAALAMWRAIAEAPVGTTPPIAGWRAELGQALSLEALGDGEAALRAHARAEARLDRLAARVPLGEGRESFLLAHRRAGIRHVDLLLRLGRSAEAFAVARRSRARLLRILRAGVRISELPPAARRKWEEAIGQYWEARDALDALAAARWKQPQDAMAFARREQRGLEASQRAALDRALALLGDTATAALPPLPAEATTLAWFPLSEGWVLFIARGGEVTALRVPTQALSAIPRRWRARITAAPRLHLLSEVPDEVLDALAAKQVVSIGLDLPRRLAARSGRALVASDPRGDLPGALDESDDLRQRFAPTFEVEGLHGARVRRAVLLRELPRAELFHYAGHARAEGPGGWRSGLRLAGHERLSVGDILTLPQAPRIVVLLGCESGDQPGEIGLAQAFVAAGAEAVLAARGALDDTEATRLAAAFYRHGGAQGDPAIALAKARRTLRDSGSAGTQFHIWTP